jgi:SHS2 domain-containing protein
MYEIFDHTADLGLRIRSTELPALFEEAAAALFSAIVENPADVRPLQEASFELEADHNDELLRHWLAELLYTFHAEHMLWSQFEVRLDGTRLQATARGEPFDPARHRLDAEIKAVTYHGLKVEPTTDGWLAEVIVDI